MGMRGGSTSQAEPSMLCACRDAVQASEEAVALAQEQVDLLTGRSSVEKAHEPREGQGGAGDPQAALLHLKALLEQHIVVSWEKYNLERLSFWLPVTGLQSGP